jgi:hypothetical protein
VDVTRPEFGDRRLPARFWEKVDPSTGCWVWTGSLNKGYPSFYANSSASRAANLIAYGALVGDVKPGWMVSTCRVRLCVNPAHRRILPGFKVGKPRLDYSDRNVVVWRGRPIVRETPAQRLRWVQREATRTRTLLACMTLAQVQAQEARLEAESRLRLWKVKAARNLVAA